MEGEPHPPPDRMEGEARPLPACVSKVLDDDNLLTEILVRAGFPTLVRAAAVCRRWLSHASDRAFLRRFRELHPPRLLGFYIAQRQYPGGSRFFPMLPLPPELTTVVHRATWTPATAHAAPQASSSPSWTNGPIWSAAGTAASSPASRGIITATADLKLYLKCAVRFAPREVWPPSQHYTSSCRKGFSKKGVACPVECTRYHADSKVHVYMLQNGDDAWRTHLTLVSDLFLYPRKSPKGVLVDNKIYVPTDNEIAVLDLASSILSTIQLPQGVGFGLRGTTMLSRTDDASGSCQRVSTSHMAPQWGQLVAGGHHLLE